jgi:hypothetical protein
MFKKNFACAIAGALIGVAVSGVAHAATYA